MVSYELWAVVGESLSWKLREWGVEDLETLPGRWVIRQRNLCAHARICGILDESDPVFWTQEVNLYMQKCALQLHTVARNWRKEYSPPILGTVGLHSSSPVRDESVSQSGGPHTR